MIKVLDLILTILLIVLTVYSLFVARKWHKVGNKYDMLADELLNDKGAYKDD